MTTTTWIKENQTLTVVLVVAAITAIIYAIKWYRDNKNTSENPSDTTHRSVNQTVQPQGVSTIGGVVGHSSVSGPVGGTGMSAGRVGSTGGKGGAR